MGLFACITVQELDRWARSEHYTPVRVESGSFASLGETSTTKYCLILRCIEVKIKQDYHSSKFEYSEGSYSLCPDPTATQEHKLHEIYTKECPRKWSR